MRNSRAAALFAALTFALAVAAAPASAQEGTLKVKVKPKTAYTLVDGKPYGQGKRTIRLAAGEHQVSIHRYGHKPHLERVTISAGQTTKLEATLEPIGAPVSGPWGRIRLLVKPNHTAVFLNGKTPDFLVGCTGATDTNFIVKQELLVRPGTHTLTLALDGYNTYTTSVTLAANQRVEIRHTMQRGSGEETLPVSAQTTKSEDRLAKLNNIPREKTGFASMRAAVAPVSAQFSASPTEISCGDSSRLTWSSSEAPTAEISGLGEVPASGERLVEPKQTTTYNFTAAGTGGRVEQSATVNVDSSIEASLSVSPGEIRYRRIGDRVVEHGTATVTWSTSNADNVTLQAEGGAANTVPASGSQTVQHAPRQTTTGPVSESVSGTLTATNPCGGRELRSATLRITGSIEPLPEVVLASIFFPTDYPDERHPNLGLLGSQRRALAQLADGFNGYLEYDPNARLLLEAHADERASLTHNQSLSQRRAAIVKQFLVDAGLSGVKVEFQAFGEEQNLERTTVEALEEQNPNPAPRPRLRSRRADWLAHNRRVDIVLRPGGERSQRYYPHHADDSNILWQVPKPSPRTVE
ncbi:MAG: PEGA domain-containing protein, partial [Terriglobia bacterium]